MENQHSGAGGSYSCILSSKFDSPPLFSPNIYIPDLHEKVHFISLLIDKVIDANTYLQKSFGPRGYLNRISYLVVRTIHIHTSMSIS